MLNVDIYFLVVHRNFITLYDLKEGCENPRNYCETVAFKHDIMTVCEVDSKKSKIDPSLQSDFISNTVIYTADNTINWIDVRKRKITKSTRVLKVGEGENLKFIYDEYGD